MVSRKPTTNPSAPQKGTYMPRQPTDIRSPCPAIHTLANHGYIARSGRDVSASEIHSALGELGVGSMLGSFFTYPPFIELHTGASAPPPSWWSTLSNPFAYMLSSFAMRNPGQKDAEGFACLNLDQLARPNVAVHDVSLSQFDHAQVDNITPQPELIKDLLAASSNGSMLTVADFVKLRKARYARQKRENPKLHFEAFQNQIACTEVALVLKVFGDGSQVPLSCLKAFFEEERLPREQGWKKRVWWSLGLVELSLLVGKIKSLVGDFEGKDVPAVAAVH